MSNPIFVERDPQYMLVRRNVRCPLPRDEWENRGARQAAIARAIPLAAERMRGEGGAAGDYEFLAPSPVTVILHQGAVLYAEITRPGGPRQFISPEGKPLAIRPVVQGAVAWKTTYAHWAEGPLPHVVIQPETPPELDEDVQTIRALNPTLRNQIDKALETQHGPVAQESDRDMVDFRIRLIFRVRDYRVLVSKQGGDSKLITSEGIVEDEAPPQEDSHGQGQGA